MSKLSPEPAKLTPEQALHNVRQVVESVERYNLRTARVMEESLAVLQGLVEGGK